MTYDYTPTPYDTKLEELINHVGQQIVAVHGDRFFEKTYDQRSEAIAPFLARQKLLRCARSPEYARYLEEKRGA
jgi:uncharacterized protein (DUF1330 family)